MEFTEHISVLLTIHIKQLNLDDGKASGFFELSTSPHASRLGAFQGNIEFKTKEFVFSNQSQDDVISGFRGRYSDNGLAMYLTISDETKVSAPFSLLHEDTSADLISKAEQDATANP